MFALYIHITEYTYKILRTGFKKNSCHGVFKKTSVHQQISMDMPDLEMVVNKKLLAVN